MAKKNLNEKLDSMYGSMGYSKKPLYDYLDEYDDLMDYEGHSKYYTDFNLKESDMEIIIKTIETAAAYQRTSLKSMMATRSSTIIPPNDIENLNQVFKDSEALVQTRQSHMKEVAIIARIISNGLGLNKNLSQSSGEGHDLGHTWNGHTGERILSAIARLKNCGYIVHNAMGAYVLERENIIEMAIRNVKQMRPKADEKEIKRFMRYVIDGIVSHNGEGVVGKIVPKDKTAEEMTEEIKKCFTEKGFDKKIMPATMEGAVIRYADIIAYTRSDILDGFRLKDVNGEKILKEFDDEYLSIIGTLYAKNTNFKSLLTLENKFLLEMYGLSERMDKLKEIEKERILRPEEKLELQRTEKERELIQKKYKEFEQDKIRYAKEYIAKIKPQSEVKTRVTEMMQNVFIKDLIEASKDKPHITMSPLIRKTLFALRDLNVRRIVPYTRRIFETEKLPIAANELVDILAETLVNTGIAYSLMPDDAKNDIKPKFNEEMQKKEENKINNDPKFELERKICHYYRNQNPKKLSFMYNNVIEAMYDITKHDVDIAIGKEEYDGELKEIYMSEKISPIKRKIGMMGKTSDTITENEKNLIIKQIVEEKKKEIEKAIASKMAIEYVGGMTDNTILARLLEKNLISREDVIKGYGRAEPGKQAEDIGVTKLQKVFADNEKMIYPDDKEDHEISL